MGFCPQGMYCHGNAQRGTTLYITLFRQPTLDWNYTQDSNNAYAASQSHHHAPRPSPYPASCAASPGARFLYLSKPGAWLMCGSCSGLLLSDEPECRRACMLDSCWSVGWLVVAKTELRPVSPSNTWRRQQHGDVGTLKSRKYLDGLLCRQDQNLASLRKHTIGRHFEFVDDCHLP